MNKIVVSLLLGIGIGILIAPHKGSKTRQKIKNTFDDLLDKAGETLDDLVDRGRNAYDTAKEKVSDNLG